MPHFSASSLWGHDCTLCGAGSRDGLVCAACTAALPLLATRCTRCAVPLATAGVCGECLVHPPAFEDAESCFEYRFPVDRLIHRFKYAGDLATGRWLALQLERRLAGEPRPDLLVAPPLSRARLRERGFNQALEIGKTLAKKLRVPCDIAGIARIHDTAPQPGLGRRARRANLRGAFRCDMRVRGAHIAIVDDVLTTGATADAVARVLKEAGAVRVSVWSVARTPESAD